MKSLKNVFVLVMTLLMVLTVFAIADAIFAGVIYLVISIWDKVFAIKFFKIAFIGLFSVETLFTIPVGISTYKEGENK